MYVFFEDKKLFTSKIKLHVVWFGQDDSFLFRLSQFNKVRIGTSFG
jgi:hypothetical protein